MRRLIPLAALLPLTACMASDEGYPSLLPRPIETRDEAEPIRPEPVAVPDAALDRQIAAQGALANATAKRFQEAAITAEARVAVARGVAPGSDSWLAAQTALADLAPIRGEMLEIVSRLEELAIARGQAGAPAYPALDAAITDIGARAAAQYERVQALEDALPG